MISFKCNLDQWLTGIDVWLHPDEKYKALIRIGFLCFRVLIVI